MYGKILDFICTSLRSADTVLVTVSESRWITSLRDSDNLTKIKGSNNILKLNDELLHTVINVSKFYP